MGSEAVESSLHSCPICGCHSTGSKMKYKGSSKLFKNLTLVSCTNCSMVYADPMPLPTCLKVYNESYFLNAHGGSDFAYSPFFSAIAKIRIKHIQKYIAEKNLSVNSVLEYGPGGGALAAEWLRINPYDTYRVVESDKSCIAHLQRFGVRTLNESWPSIAECSKRPESASFAGLDFDLLIMSHVLEHVADPRQFLHEALQRLKPGGILFIEVPCRDYLFKDIWEPHLLFFDKPQLTLLLRDLGLTFITTTYHGRTIDAQISRTSLHNLFDRLKGFFIESDIFPHTPQLKSLDFIDSVKERASIFSFEAHNEKSLPSTWLRSLAIKSSR